MKKITTLSFLLAFACLTGSVFAQNSKNVIKINLWSPVVSTASLFYERALTEKVSAQLGVSYTGAKSNGTSFSGLGITPEVRFYLSEKAAPAGFFVAPFARYRTLTMKTQWYDYDTNGNLVEEEVKGTWNQIGGGLVLGAQWLFANDHVAFGLFGGPAYYSNTFKYDDENSSSAFNIRGAGGFSFRSGLTLGVAF